VNAGLKALNPPCWEACGPDADNVTSLCAVSCLFTTLLGNTSSGVRPTREGIVQPFADAFKPLAEGGCGDP
jgi:hypothetical protein